MTRLELSHENSLFFYSLTNGICRCPRTPSSPLSPRVSSSIERTRAHEGHGDQPVNHFRWRRSPAGDGQLLPNHPPLRLPRRSLQGAKSDKIQGNPSPGNLGWVDFDFSCSTLCLVLLGLTGNWQNWLSSLARWWNIPNQSQHNRGSPGHGSPCMCDTFWEHRKLYETPCRMRGRTLHYYRGRPTLLIKERPTSFM